MEIILLATFLIAYSLNLFFIDKKRKYGCLVTKLLLTPTLFLFYIFRNDAPVLVVFFALLFCFFGDLFLEFGDKETCFLLGLGSFLIGHIFYIICFIQQISQPILWWLFFSLIAYVVYGIVFYRRLNIKERKLKAATAIYCGILMFASLTAMLRVESVSTVEFLLTFIGTILFIASDSILAYNSFNRRIRYSGLLIMSTYGMAQLLIISGL